MIRKKVVLGCIAAIVSTWLVLGLVVLPRQSPDLSAPEPVVETDAVIDLGITYLRVTPMLSAYYDLGVDSGVLVTEVTPGSPMDLASVQAGDVILSYNGTEVGESVSLLGIMRTCRPDDSISLEVCRNKDCSIIEFCSCCGTPDCDCGGPVYVPIYTDE
jgi:membrane-associated protease RseP (regulator of RpoE activity)